MSEENKNVSEDQKTEARRDFIKKTAYIAPVVVTMGMTASFAAHGSTAVGGTIIPPLGAYGNQPASSDLDCAVGGKSEYHTDCTGNG